MYSLSARSHSMYRGSAHRLSVRSPSMFCFSVHLFGMRRVALVRVNSACTAVAHTLSARAAARPFGMCCLSARSLCVHWFSSHHVIPFSISRCSARGHSMYRCSSHRFGIHRLRVRSLSMYRFSAHRFGMCSVVLVRAISAYTVLLSIRSALAVALRHVLS